MIDTKVGQKALLDAVNQIMPFGKYAGKKLITLPEPYFVWFRQQGFPAGTLGEQMALVYEIKRNGLEQLFIQSQSKQHYVPKKPEPWKE